MSYIENWDQLVIDHHKQSENKIIKKEQDDFWEDKVEGFIPPELPDYNDPTLSFLLSSLLPQSSVLDLGGGAGRLSIPLAQNNYVVTIIDSSKAMIRAADKHANHLKLNNVKTFHSTWEEYKNENFDHIICAHVMYGIYNIKNFILKMLSSVNSNVIIIMYDHSPQSHLADIWELYYSEKRINLPGITELENVITELNLKYKLYDIDEYNLPVFDDFDSLLNSVISQIFITPNKDNISKLSDILKNYMTIDKDQFVFPLDLKRKLKAIVIDKV